MAITYTKEQDRVIHTTGKDILVSAAAGSGKTAVLVARIMRMITDEKHPVDIDRLLIVTFTKAAASEMRERIGRAIREKLLLDPENEQLQRQATYIHKAQITTIDSFCKYLITNHFESIGVDPSLRVADQAESKLLMQDVMEELMEDWHAHAGEDFINCLESFATGKSEEDFEKQILSLYNFAMSYPWPKEWLKDCLSVYACESSQQLQKARFMRELIKTAKLQIKEARKLLESAVALCEEADGPYMYASLLEQEMENLQCIEDKNGYEEAFEAFQSLTFAKLPAKKDASVDPGKRELAKNLRTKAKDLMQRCRDTFFPISLEQAFCDLKGCSSNVKVLIDLTTDFMDRYAAKKADKKIMDFQDMEHMALDILYTKKDDIRVPSDVALMYRDYFEQIMIDEYQDSNLVQELLLMSMARNENGKRNCFMVGDVKQSIYKFRLARPEIFMEKYAAFDDEGDQIHIDLHQNFRSRMQVLDLVNLVFERIMESTLGGIDYDDAARLFPGASYQENADCDPELLVYECRGGEEAASPDKREGEAMMVAQRIRNLVGVMDVTAQDGTIRKARYGDIVILLRTADKYGQEYKRALEKRGIPVYVPVSTGYFSATEIRQILDYLKILNNPYHDIPLCSVLKSPFFDFSDEELSGIKAWTGETEGRIHFYDAMRIYAGACEDPAADNGLAGKVQRALDKIDENRRRAVHLRVHELILELMGQCGYMDYQTALPGGIQRRANLEMLLQKAADFEKTSYHGLFDFVRYMDQLETYEVDFGEAGIVDEQMDAVRIMTIHKSKGLEFPICFVSSLAKQYNMRSQSSAILTDMDLGLAVDYIDPSLRIKAPTVFKNYVAFKQKMENIGEEMRILYVALTRAKEKLILTCQVPSWEHTMEKLAGVEGEKVLPYVMRSNVTSNLTLILAALQAAGSLGQLATILHENDVWQADVLHETDREYRKEILFERMKESDGDKLFSTLKERFAYTYPHQVLAGLYTKTSVSELKKAAMQQDEQTHVIFETDDRTRAYLPGYLRREEAGGTERGSAYHKVLELLDYKKYGEMSCLSINECSKTVDTDMENLVKSGLLSAGYRELVNPMRIARFLKSTSAHRMGIAAKEGKLFKEQPFVMQIPANLLGKEFPKEEGVLIQGIIDVYFHEQDELIVLDYKTDRVEKADELIKRYQTQLDYYADALEKLTGLRVKEKIIYSFALDQEISLQ
ncbi:MAG: helicase-exonuclease AddAB subunit AddA [Lachnospiraceae bacterium]|nr:helicase-exonuclease AddAB subunit AddA [Lachnospiraceae bacterium]